MRRAQSRGLFIVASLAAAGAYGEAQRQTFRTTTRLVEVSVVVTDKAGNPVEGLKREEFTVTEDGVPQPISIFEVTDTRAAAVAVAPPASNTGSPRVFTNRVREQGGATTVILLDRLNAAFDSQWFARKHVDRYLEAMRPGDRAALYVLDGPLRVLHDFSGDREALRRTLNGFTLRTTAQYDGSNEAPIPTPAEGVAVWLVDPSGTVAEFFSERRSLNTVDAFRYLARHLSGTPGRKSIVWVSEAFAMPLRNGRAEFMARLRRAIQALSDAQVTLYPVDARGLVGALHAPGGRAAFTTFTGVRGNIETMQYVAEQTGGRAFFNTNALDVSIRRAVDDSRLTYLIGYYPADAKWDGRYRSLAVQVKRSGLLVRQRRGFYATAPANDQAARNNALREALEGPLQSTAVGLSAIAERGADSELRVTVRIDADTLSFDRSGGTFRAAVDLLLASVSPKGVGTIATTANLDITITDEARARASREGLPVTRTIRISPDALQLRIVARDALSGEIGSLVIPAAELR